MSSRREFVRVQAVVGIAYQVIPESEWDQWKSGSLLVSRRQREHSSGEIDFSLGRAIASQLDPEVARFLEHLDKKLSCLLDLVNRRQDETIGSSQMVPTSLSGCGISFSCEDLEIGNHVLLTMELSGSSMSRVEVVGTVARVSSEPGEGRSVAILFDQITEADRETIIRYTFQIQRDIAKLNMGGGRAVAVEE